MGIFTTILDMLHIIGEYLLYPTIIALVVMLITAIVKLGGFIVEVTIERRNFVAKIPKLLRDINSEPFIKVKNLLENSGLLKRQRAILMELLDNEYMSKTSMTALAERLLADEEERYMKGLEALEIMCKIGPMLGLLGTLIPLGPGLYALGQGDVAKLSEALMVAFDTTIIGIACASVSFVILTIRKRWYNQYISQLESIMVSLLEKLYPEPEELVRRDWEQQMQLDSQINPEWKAG